MMQVTLRYLIGVLATGVPEALSAQQVGAFSSDTTCALGVEQKHVLSSLQEKSAFWNALGLKGNIEAGLLYGRPMYSTAAPDAVNFVGRGDIGVSVLGVPIRVTFDAGTDAYTRGQRNRFQVSLDQQRLLRQVGQPDAAELTSLNKRIDSLEHLRAMKYRQWKSADERLRYLQGNEPSTILPMNNALPDTTLLQDVLVDVPIIDTLQVQPLDANTELAQVRASLTRREEELSQIRSEIDELRRQQAKAVALQNAQRKGLIPDRALASIKKFEIGTCVPQHSQFMINGTTIQGVSTEVLYRDFYLALDHGASYDDAIRQRRADEARARWLNEVFLFENNADLNPKRLTSIKTGLGRVDGTHFHVGLLRASQTLWEQETPSGSQMSTPDLLNHVVEFDMAWAISRKHAIRYVFATSTVRTAGAGGEDEGNGLGLFDRGGGAQQAMCLEWSSSFKRTGTRVDLSGGMIGQDFHSAGMAFVRPGSKAAQVRVMQDLGKRFRLRTGMKHELRQPDGPQQASAMVTRGDLLLRFRPAKWLALHAGWAPVSMHVTDQLTERTDVLQAGSSAHRRWGRHLATFMVSAVQYNRTSTIGAKASALSLDARCRVEQDQRWSIGAGTGSFSTSDTLATFASTVDLEMGIRPYRHTRVDATATFPLDGPAIGWRLSATRALSRTWYLLLQCEKRVTEEIFLVESVERSNVRFYTCQVSIGWRL